MSEYNGMKKWLSTTNHKEVGILYLWTSIIFFVIGGLFALVMRTQLAQPDQAIFGDRTAEIYNQLVTMHGIVMIIFFLSPFAFAFGNYIVPIQIGAADLIFPRLNALSYWMYLAGGLVSLSGFAVGGAAAGGWTLYAPLSLQQGLGVDMVAIGIALFVIGVTVSTINFMVTYLRLRAPGMTLYQMPMFSWAVFFTVVIMLFAFPALGAAGLMLIADRNLAFHFFDISNGGAILWAHLFWFFGHPEVYILLLPGLGAVLEVIPTFAERPLWGKKAVVWSLAIATFLSFIVYIHHMFTTGVDPGLRKAMTITTEMISIPFGIIYLSLIATLWRGRIRFEVPMLFAIGFIVLFLVGGLTGVFLSSVAIDYGMQGSYWVVAHFHYAVLGGGVWGVLAALYFWFPKLTGKMFNERMGRVHFWMGFVGFNLLFMSMFFYGKMPRRIYTYAAGSDYATGLPLGLLNTIATVGAFMFAAGIGLMIVNFLWSWKHGSYAGHDPWGGDSLEWTISSPPPQHNFTRTPVLAEPPIDAEKHTGAAAGAVSMVTETKL
ncbi:MAG TPA: cbb3-type cytochrome c oxidase subunit I [Candidatus Thermoplasmatota archaeon]|nr:cbb3-type cytochrome c oxidase subunit I [Candidatus Thermoplasmatota archaeon]